MTLREAIPRLSLFLVFSSVPAIGAELQVGLADFRLESGGDPPTGTALFRLVNPDDVLVSEAGVGAAPLLRRGRIFVQQSGSWRTGLALANPEDRTVALRLVLRTAGGIEIDRVNELSLTSHEHLAKFVDELFDDLPAEFEGSLSFEGLLPTDQVAAVTLRQSTNGHGEPLFATLPVASLDDREAGFSAPDALIFPQVGAGPGLSTQLLLMSRSDLPARGRIRMTASNGSPLIVHSSQGNGSEFPFELPAHGVLFVQLTAPAGTDVAVGYAQVQVTQGDLPTGTAVFRYYDAAGTISEAGVGPMPLTRKARIFIDSDQTSTGVAIANPGHSAASITFRLLDGNGFQLEEVDRELPAGRHLAAFASELFALSPRFAGLVEIEGDTEVVPITLKFTINGRGEAILTTLPVADLIHPPQGSRVVFPQIGAGGVTGVGEFSTQLIFIGPIQEQPAFGRIHFWKGVGTPLRLDRVPSELVFGVGGAAAARVHFTDEPLPVTVVRGEQTSVQVGLDGGTILLEDDRQNLILLQIPPFALQTPTTITMTVIETKATKTLGRTLFPGVVLEPEGLVLLEPARLSVFTADPLAHPERTRLHIIDIDGTLWPVPNPMAAGEVVAGDLHHFTEFTVDEENLGDLMMGAAAIYGQTDPVLKERLRRYYEEKFGTTLPEYLVELLVRLDDLETLAHYYGLQDALGVQTDNSAIQGWLEQLVLSILSQPAPADPCGLYQTILSRVLSMLPSLGDPTLEAHLRSRISQVDSQCISESLVGDWMEEPQWQAEICAFQQGREAGEIEEEEETEPYHFRVAQTGSQLHISFPDFPDDPTFTGRVRKTSSTTHPYRITASNSGADSLDCITFFQSGGFDLEFGVPICPSGSGCTPLSCQEYQIVGASVQASGSRLAGTEYWTFAASAVVHPSKGPSYISSVTCQGQGPFSAVKLP